MPNIPTPAGQRVAGAARGLTPRQVAQVLSRYQGPEQFFQQPFNVLDSPVLPNNINLNRPMESIEMWWLGRVTIAGANYDTVAAEAPQTIIQKVILQGTHKKFNQIIPINMSGATIFAWPRLFQEKGNSLIINGVMQPELSVPLSQVPANFGNIGTYDLAIQYTIPLAPMFGPAARRSVNYFLYQPQDWVGQSLQLQLFFGDATSFGTPNIATTVTFSALGSNTGQPQVMIDTNYAILGAAANKISAGVIIRNEQSFQGGSLSSIGNNIRIAQLQKQKTTNVVLKTGVQLAGTSPSVIVFQTLDDTVLERTQIIVDNKPVKNNNLNIIAKNYAGRQFNTTVPGGYLNFPFVESQTPLTYFRGDQVSGGSNFEIDSDVLTNTGFGTFVQEQVLGNPMGLG
jgi:hypothetical protein